MYGSRGNSLPFRGIHQSPILELEQRRGAVRSGSCYSRIHIIMEIFAATFRM